ncbi:TonB-dependent siderophore receptor [Acidovorax sp. SUPP950]|uniref:TonB-dependent siderophore receptor n=1 Tax=unclassified Acidovorax TaxID=2684926 RepID=UPI0023BE833E|nr:MULTISPECIES: TonB-dependent siderophore receptor [Comamonadaceae]WOI47739.1 TonB-dependent siderophore receptor [Paracidovorax avenae]GKS75861.1 TonB-dependent siderophore receptor [Acidovorax sp. SUPP950]GKS94146.1 TonB-dependent siderophore receptor [Acidovorax sp. SUPP2825]
MRLPPLNAITAAAWLAAATTAHAQTAAPTVALPEVKVTDAPQGEATEGSGQYIAREISVGKLVQSPRETPQSVSVITRQRLDDMNLTKLEDAVKQTTGVNVTRLDGAGNYNTIQSRGFDIGALLLDGVPIPQGPNYATAMDTAIYDRIEVLRGPSGLLQGASEPGGTINLVRKRAQSALGLNANVSAGSWNMRRADVDLTGALNAAGTLRGRVVAVKDDRDSHVATLKNDKTLGYGTLELDITPSTTLSVGHTRQKVRATVDQGLPAYADGRLLDVPRSTFAGIAANRQDLDNTDTFAELEHRLSNGGQVKFVARDVHRESLYRSVRANSAVAANGNYQLQSVDFQQDLKDRNYDLYIASPLSLAGRTHRVLLGVSHTTSESLDGNSAFGAPRTANIFNPQYDLPYPSITLPGFQSATRRTENALYGQAQVSVAERLKVLAGGRLSWAKAETRTLSTGQTTATADPGRQFIPSVAAIYELNENLSAYTSYAETFVVQSSLDRAGRLLTPRSGSQIEAGVKGEFLNKRLQTHFALFRILDKDRAIADPDVPTASLAGGKVRAQGFETEVSGQVAPGWDVLAGYAFTATKYLQAPVSQQGQVFSPITPRHSVNLSTRYAFKGPVLQGLSVGGGVSYRSEFFAQSGTVRLTSGDYALFNAQVAYQINDKLSVSLNVDNLFDKTYYEKVSSLGRQNFYGEPRRVTVALKARY